MGPEALGRFEDRVDEGRRWILDVDGANARHLAIGLSGLVLPPGATLTLEGVRDRRGPWRSDDVHEGVLWTPAVQGARARVRVELPPGARGFSFRSLHVAQGFRGLSGEGVQCKAGDCHLDVACLDAADPWNLPRGAVATYTVEGVEACTGVLLNNTANDGRMLFATAAHCLPQDLSPASVVVYFHHAAAECRRPGTAANAQPIAREAPALVALRRIAATMNPFSGQDPGGTRSDVALIELATPSQALARTLHWAGWDRRDAPANCAAPQTPQATSGACATLHHPGGEEQRITFSVVPTQRANLGAAVGVHWRADWDLDPPRPPGLTSSATTSIPPGATETGGAPLFDPQRRVVGVLSGGASACGAPPAAMHDEFGAFAHAWNGLGTPATRLRDHLDPIGTQPMFIDGREGCEAPRQLAAPALSAPAPNRVSATWPALSGAGAFRVWRSEGGCPGIAQRLLATTPGPEYLDDTVSGGSRYGYRIEALDPAQACGTLAGPCAEVLATGNCTLAPNFDGRATSSSAASATCAVSVFWPSAIGRCGQGAQLRYSVHRSTVPEFVPDASNRILSCHAGTSLLDREVASGHVYYYAVVAEDLTAPSSQGACGGTPAPTVLRTQARAAAGSVVWFADDAEQGGSSWISEGQGAGANFAVTPIEVSPPSHAWFVPDPAAPSDRTLRIAQPLALPYGFRGRFEFRQRIELEAEPEGLRGFDGGVLEYSLDGASWHDALEGTGPVPSDAHRFLEGGYTHRIAREFGSPLADRRAWSGRNRGAYARTQVRLDDFAGLTLHLRLRFASDGLGAAPGWWLDDLRVVEDTPCEAVSAHLLFRDGFEP